MAYIDGFVLPIKNKNLAAYVKMSKKAGKVWKEYGALEYRELAGDDMQSPVGVPFPKLAKAKAGETVVFSYIRYKSKAHRDQVNKKVMKDPRLAAMCDPKNTPFDMNRMSMGGFKTIVEA